jgi:molecular chaperone GrpE
MMNKEDNNKKKDHPKDSPLNHGEPGQGDSAADKNQSRKDKVRKTDADEEIIKQWQAKYDELNDKYLRLYSEFDNYRKRTQKERIEFSKNASEDIILTLLPVIDDLERALTSTLKTGEGLEVVPKVGLQLIYQKFKNILSQKGLEEIPAMGESFDVDFHHAITNIPAPSDEMKGKVIDEVEKGYKLNGKVIRYSKVVVGN